MKGRFIDFHALSEVKIQEAPFPYGIHDKTVFDSAGLASLAQTFPATDRIGHNNIEHMRLPEPWQAFKRELKSSQYREAIQQATGVDLREYRLKIGLRYWSKPSFGKPQSDVLKKRLTHLMYFNESWPHKRGRFQILNSKRQDDVFSTVTPVAGSGVFFSVSKVSHHGYESFQGVRKAVQVNFEKMNLGAKLGARLQ